MMSQAQTDAIFSAKSDLDAIRDRLGAAIGALFPPTDVTRSEGRTHRLPTRSSRTRVPPLPRARPPHGGGDPLAALERLRPKRTSTRRLPPALAA